MLSIIICSERSSLRDLQHAVEEVTRNFYGVTVRTGDPTAREIVDAIVHAPCILVFLDMNMQRSILSGLLREVLRHGNGTAIGVEGLSYHSASARPASVEGPEYAAIAQRIARDQVDIAMIKSIIARGLYTAASLSTKALTRKEYPLLPEKAIRAFCGDLGRVTSYKTLARLMHARETWVIRLCNRAGIDSAERLAMWVRILTAAELLCWGIGNVGQVAHLTGFPTTHAFCNAVRRYLHTHPRALSMEFGMPRILEAFHAAVEKHEI